MKRTRLPRGESATGDVEMQEAEEEKDSENPRPTRSRSGAKRQSSPGSGKEGGESGRGTVGGMVGRESSVFVDREGAKEEGELSEEG